jgi:OOP family OmpA-OmpF porin
MKLIFCTTLMIMVLFQTINAQEDTSENKFKSYSKFDFVPGEQVIYFEDFSQDAIGDFPAKWNTNSSGEIVTIDNISGKWMKTARDGKYKPEIKTGGFPDNFTIEFDLIFKAPDAPQTGSAFQSIYLYIFSAANEKILSFDEANALGNGTGALFIVQAGSDFAALNWKNGEQDLNSHQNKELFVTKNGKSSHVAIWIQKQRGRLYIDETKVFDLPVFLPAGAKYNAISFTSIENIEEEQLQNFISNIRIAVGAPDMRNRLLTDGKLVTHGILFDVNSDKIKPESYGTLKEIAQVLNDNPGLKVKITGHTDSDGNPASNLDLSKRRAVSVKNSLNKDFGIDASRIETDGKGSAESVSPNTSPEGKANNRRVEFTKI